MALEHHRGGSGEPLLLIHGIGSCWQAWKPVIPELEKEYDVIAVDLPGYGRSAPLDGEPTVFAIGDALEAFLDELGFDKVHVAGNSMGGSLTAGLAERGRALTATTFSPGGLFTTKEFEWADRLLRQAYAGAVRSAPYAEKITATAAGRLAAFWLSNSRPWRVDPADGAHQIRMMGGSPSFSATLAWIERERPMPPNLDKIDCPFTVAWGTWDVLLPVRQAARWKPLVRDARIELMPGLGHVPMADDPQEVVRVIRATAVQGRRETAPVAASA